MFPKSSNKKKLVVDDNKLNIVVVKKLLKDCNYEIDECYDGKECLDKIIQGNKYDLILMDIMMPNMSGETCITKLKETKNFNTPVIALTADAIAGAEEKYLNEGFVDYISKPFSKQIIQEKIEKNFLEEISSPKPIIKEEKRIDWDNVPKYYIGDNCGEDIE